MIRLPVGAPGPETGALLAVSALGVLLTILEQPAGYFGIVSITLAWVLTPLVAALLREALPAQASVVTTIAAEGWHDSADDAAGILDDPAHLETCASCALTTPRQDAVTVGGGVLCSRCDANR